MAPADRHPNDRDEMRRQLVLEVAALAPFERRRALAEVEAALARIDVRAAARRARPGER